MTKEEIMELNEMAALQEERLYLCMRDARERELRGLTECGQYMAPEDSDELDAIYNDCWTPEMEHWPRTSRRERCRYSNTEIVYYNGEPTEVECVS